MHTEHVHKEAITSTYCVHLYQKGDSADKRRLWRKVHVNYFLETKMEIIIETSAKHFVTKKTAPKDTFNILMTSSCHGRVLH